MALFLQLRCTWPWVLASTAGWAAFPSQTEVLTQHGLRPISELQPSDCVVSLREGRETLRAVHSISAPYLKEGVVLQTEGGQPLLCSADQLFWTLRGWQCASELECGEELFTAEGRWVPLVFPPLPRSLQAVELCLEPIEQEQSPNERVFWAGPQRLLCHNDLILVPLITIGLSSGQIATISGLALASAATAFGSWWIASELETRLNRLGFPDAHILSVDAIWMESADADKEPFCLELFHAHELKPWFEQASHEWDLGPIHDPSPHRAPHPLQWSCLAPAAREALLAQIEKAVETQLRR